MDRYIIGLINGWGVKDWIGPAINQALTLCDEVIVDIDCWHDNLRKFQDETYDITQKYSDSIKIITNTSDRDLNYQENRSNTLNAMLSYSNLFDVGNWVWLLDADEFYSSHIHHIVRNIINYKDADEIVIKEKFFYINMRYYLNALHRNRLVKIKSTADKFMPTNRWSSPPKSIITLENGMFHYSLLQNTSIHKVVWELENNHFKVKWLDKIYKNYDPNNENYWLQQNQKLLGIKSPYYNTTYKPSPTGELYRYDENQPIFIQQAGLDCVDDFRTFYN